MKYKNFKLVRGDYKGICDSCGFDFWRSQLRKRPKDKLLVCKDCYEEIHPQERITIIPETIVKIETNKDKA